MPSTSTPDAILDCARASIVAGGYNGFSYADIAAVVGIRKASIHHHFPTKVDLVRTLVQRYRADAEAGMAESLRTVADPVARLHGYTDYWAACIGVPDTSYCLCALLATQIPVLPDEVAAEVRAYFRALSDWLTAALETGAAQGIFSFSGSPRAEAEVFMATVHGAMLSARAHGDPGVFAAIADSAIDRLRAHT
ncbi:TetR family transcriptional regulator [Mycolicibacterium murale]|uniref:TetR family transcriptional regulator n=1 Tax=Mycolicibacterium murale TaxID=182220 RepID=A0A7I9WG71_9MYCO|nr:TetR/AcrR family transcriptional regulator [Mycolicibacterium murale]MCV7183135.1 TetR/AcrR family transcriptional regulator [Mycolicibacterium murale]GFG56694.1 TetR family transcriptional regulator [Mycolicibacterium murale]